MKSDEQAMGDTARCTSCMFWERMDKYSSRGLCRRNAPTDVTGGCWPVTREVDWCGEHKQAERAEPSNEER